MMFAWFDKWIQETFDESDLFKDCLRCTINLSQEAFKQWDPKFML